jgi:hypothetical protein
VQRRDAGAQVRQVASMSWTDGWATQHSIPVTYDGHPYLFTVDEGGSGGVKLIDIADEANPAIVNSIKLEINLPENIDSQVASGIGGSAFAYESHYSSADRPANPTALASVIGVPILSAPAVLQAAIGGQFDLAEAESPRSGMVVTGDLSSDWCFSPPEWRGNDLWAAVRTTDS